ncbi:DUF397 domain-containing protein [Streptomyces sp. NPDC056628]|uniref:DUF397 domain-containing protein n=1 Tax=Streptomyces sp. NPDC056628 TaxID=3345882 RepID=UPI0036782667
MHSTERPWRKSSYSMGNGGNCVEVADDAHTVDADTVVAPAIGVRDSKVPDGPVLTLPREQWQAFVAGLKGLTVLEGRKGSEVLRRRRRVHAGTRAVLPLKGVGAENS